jgi:predicted transcriptional regulator YdeE
LHLGAKNDREFEGYKPAAIPQALKVIKGYKELNGLEITTTGNNVQIVKVEEKQYVGVAVTSPFHNVTGIGEAKQLFEDRRNEIQNTVTTDEYVCLHFANEVVFTYIYCMEVSAIDAIPDGMIGFTVPSSRYAKVRTKDEDPYGLIHTYLQENGIERNPNLFSQEVFRFGEEESKYNADILVPIMNE